MSSIKAVLFDFMGTCLDWHSTIKNALPAELSDDQRSKFALEWRQGYFDYNAERLKNRKQIEDFDETQRRVLDIYLGRQPEIKYLFTSERKESLVRAWHHQSAWPDVAGAVKNLRKRGGYEVIVHANGSTRLQLDVARSAGLQFDLLLSSEMLGTYKPGAENYLKALQLLRLKPEECVTVAAHAYDTRGAKAVGMKTVYVYRWTDDILEDQDVVKKENDAYLLDMCHLGEAIARL